MLRALWCLPGQGIEPMCPALAGGFLTTGPPGKSQRGGLLIMQIILALFSKVGCQLIEEYYIQFRIS